MMYARRPLSRLRTDFSSTSPAVMAFWERSASRPASRAVCVARIRTTKAAASSTAAAVVNNSIRADSDFEIPTWTRAPQRLYSPHRRGEAVDTRVASPLGMPNSALIVIDMINTYDHPDAHALTGSLRESLPQMVELVERAAGEDVLIVYVNDNIGPGTSTREHVVDPALGGPSRDLVEPIPPEPETSFVVKARHSIFYETPLEYVLR